MNKMKSRTPPKETDPEEAVWGGREEQDWEEQGQLEESATSKASPEGLEERVWEHLQRLADRYYFPADMAAAWLNYTEGKIPYAMVKVSGSCLNAEVARDIADLSQVISLAVVVGGGEQITEECIRRGLTVDKYGPWRVTGEKVLDVVVEVMTRETEKFALLIQQSGGKASPLVGTSDKPLIFADKVDCFTIKSGQLEAGYFGTIPLRKERAYLTDLLLKEIRDMGEAVPVIAALGHQWSERPEQGYHPLNIDGDEAIRIIARRVGAEECLFVTPGGAMKDRQRKVVRLLSLQNFEQQKRKRGLEIDESLALKLNAGFEILKAYGGEIGVALVPPDELVLYLLDRDLSVHRSPADPLFRLPPRRWGVYYGTTLKL